MVYRIGLIVFLGSFSLFLISASYSSNSREITNFQNKLSNGWISIPPFSGGPAANGLGDRTGSPITTGGSCTNCHTGGAFNPSISISVMDGTSPVSSYIPGNTYTIRFTVTANSAGFGFQAVALNSNNTAAGSFNNPASNVQVVMVGDIPYLEHFGGISPTGIFETSWTAPIAGSGNAIIYTRGLAVNGNGQPSGDKSTASVNITLTEEIPNSLSNLEQIPPFISPNPVSGVFEIQNEDQFGSIQSISLLDSNGKVIRQITIGEKQVDMQALDEGRYYLRIIGEAGSSTILLMKI